MAGKAEMIDVIAEKAGISKREAADAYEAFVSYVAETCRNGGRCSIPGLGSFSVSERKAREGRNPRTKEPIAIPASKNVRFKAGKDLRDVLNVPRAASSR